MIKPCSPEIADAVTRFAALLEMLPQQLMRIPVEEFTLVPAPNKWSKQQIVGHLIDSASNNHHRFIRAQYEDEPTIVYNQNNWNTLNGYETANRETLIQLLCSYNLHLLYLMQHIPDENLAKKCYTGNTESYTLVYLINDYVSHFEHHLTQIIN